MTGAGPVTGLGSAPISVAELLARLAGRGDTLAIAESLTGGMLSSALTSVPGSSAVVRGCVVAYATDVKSRLLGVDAGLLARLGPVDAEVAGQMARGVRMAMDATYGVATTGEAGPHSASGRPVGTVHVAVDGPAGVHVVSLQAAGGREQVRAAAVDAALDLLDRVTA